MVNENDDEIGKFIGNYRIVTQLGQSLSSNVFLAQHTLLSKRIVIVKVLRNEHLSSPQKQAQFLREAEFLDMLKHPYILALVDFGMHEGRPYLMTEYAPGGSLRERIERRFSAPFPLEEAMTLLSHIGQAVQYAHQHRIIHCDLKPDNVFLRANGDALLADFGLAEMLSTGDVEHSTAHGTFYYMAPERFDGVISKEGDQYALGCIAYELFTGHKPFNAFSIRDVVHKHLTEQPVPPTQLNAQLPLSIEQAILRSLAKERTERYPDILTFLAALGMPTVSTLFFSSGQTSELEMYRKSKEQWLDEGLIHYEAKRYEEALTAYKYALTLDTGDVYAWISQALVLCDLTRYSEALQSLEHALELDATDVDAWMSKGLVLTVLEQYEAAHDAYQHAHELEVDTGEVSAVLGSDGEQK